MSERKKQYEAITVLANAARTASGTGDPVYPHWRPNAYMLVMDQTDAQDAVGDLLDVYVDTAFYIGAVPYWFPICRFTPTVGNGANALTYVNKVGAGEPMGAERELIAGAAYAMIAGEVIHLVGDVLRARWVVTNGGGAHSFSFGVSAIPM